MGFDEMTIKEIEQFFSSRMPTQEERSCLSQDSRRSVQQFLHKCALRQKEVDRVHNLYKYEYEIHSKYGFSLIAGVDEAGRGPLAGPVVAAAVIMPLGCFLPRVNDSKKLSPKVRAELYDLIKEQAIAVSSASADEKIIDRVNIYQATMNCMYEALFSLSRQPQEVLIDAVQLEQLPVPSMSIVKGDAKSVSIAAASIIAKVERDRLMDQYDKVYPEYGFAQHKGYGTAEHMAALRKYGPCPIHRRSFEPVRSMVNS